MIARTPEIFSDYEEAAYKTPEEHEVANWEKVGKPDTTDLERQRKSAENLQELQKRHAELEAPEKIGNPPWAQKEMLAAFDGMTLDSTPKVTISEWAIKEYKQKGEYHSENVA